MKKFRECLEKLGSLLKKCHLISLIIRRSMEKTRQKLSKIVAYKIDPSTTIFVNMFLLISYFFIWFVLNKWLTHSFSREIRTLLCANFVCFLVSIIIIRIKFLAIIFLSRFKRWWLWTIWWWITCSSLQHSFGSTSSSMFCHRIGTKMKKKKVSIVVASVMKMSELSPILSVDQSATVFDPNSSSSKSCLSNFFSVSFLRKVINWDCNNYFVGNLWISKSVCIPKLILNFVDYVLLEIIVCMCILSSH